MSQKYKLINWYISSKEEISYAFDNSSKRKSSKEVTKPFSKSIKTKKDTTTYNAHSYPTKVPPEGIMPFLQHYTSKGDVVLDPFCGSGMTGLATRMLSQEIGEDRTVLLNDLGTAATHIAYNYNNPIDLQKFLNEATSLLAGLKEFRNQVYKTYHPISGKNWIDVPLSVIKSTKSEDGVYKVKYKGERFEFIEAEIVTAIWSEVNECKSCHSDINLWTQAMNPKTGKMAKTFKCSNCKSKFSRSDFDYPIAHEMSYLIYEYQVPGSNRKKRTEREPAEFDFDLLKKVESSRITSWYPQHDIAPTREMMTMGPAKLGVKTVKDFYTKRNLNVCSKIWDAIESITCKRTKAALHFASTNTFWHATRMRRFNVKGGMRPLTGTLYIPQISAECNVFRVLEKKINDLTKFYSSKMFEQRQIDSSIDVYHLNESATNMKSIPRDSIDYIFTDPPFGGNIFYSDCNVIWEGWLDKLTDDENEILFNRSRKPKDGGKTRDDYHRLMNEAFKEMYRVLKPGKWASIVFNNSDNDVLAGFIDAANKAGFEVKEVTFFDKEQKSVKGYMGQKGTQNVTNCDIVLTVHKALRKKEKSILSEELKKISDAQLYNLVENYLQKLPKLVKKQNTIYTDEHRTSPFIHSMLLRHFIKKKIDLELLTLERIHRVCEERGMNYVGGKWYVGSPKELAV